MNEDFRGVDGEFGSVTTITKLTGQWSSIVGMSIVALIAIGLYYVVYLFLFESPEDTLVDRVCGTLLVGALAVGATLVFLVFVPHVMPDKVVLYRDAVREYRRRTILHEMRLDSSVTVHLDVSVDKVPSLKGYHFQRGDEKFHILSTEGYHEVELYNAWDKVLEVVRAKGMRTTDTFDKYVQYREGTLPPPHEDPLRGLPPLSKAQTLRESIKIIDTEEHETGRSKELIESMIQEGREPEKSIWSTESKHRWVLTFARAQILAVLVLGAVLGGVWDEGHGLTSVIVILTVAAVLEGVFAWFLVRINKRQMRFFEAEVDMERDDTFRSLMGVFMALRIDYHLSRDVDSMPSKRQWYDGQFVSITFDLGGRSYTLEVLGYTSKNKTLLLLSDVPKAEDPALERLKGFISVGLLKETGYWADV